MKIAVTGALGQLGSELCRQLGHHAIPLTSPEFNLTDHLAVGRMIREHAPKILINCAAYTAVDKAEEEPELCHQVNAESVAALADVCNGIGCKLVQISTDYVFGGTNPENHHHREEDLPNPVGVYATSKREGETMAKRCANHLIVRSCGLYCATPGRPIRGRNFPDTLRSLAEQRTEFSVVDDQWVNPSYVPDVARAIVFLARSDQRGIFHVVNGGVTTWHGFATTMFQLAGIGVTCTPITTQQYGAKAPRPRYSALNTEKYERLGGPELPTWKSGLERYLQWCDRRLRSPGFEQKTTCNRRLI